MTTDETNRETGGAPGKRPHAPAVAIAVFAVIYFLFPQVLLYPVFRFYHGVYPQEAGRVIGIVFYPDIALLKVCPPYHRMIHWEGRMMGMY